MLNRKDRAGLMRETAKTFVERAREVEAVLEVAIVGAVAGEGRCTRQLDLAVVVSSLDDFEELARAARRLGPVPHAWRVFVFDREMRCRGTICLRRECPGADVQCSSAGCGAVPHVRCAADNEYVEATFFGSPLEIVWSRAPESLFLSRKAALGIRSSRSRPLDAGVTIECTECGRTFRLDDRHRRWYLKRGLSLPKRCAWCRDRA